ncbi:hypothetical protein [Oceanispirochaeta sp. M1]|uniref:hypothetical protein n=2 Tax=unclassified Oceanispirochaeta TaxID=2635722 RepID=UPI000E09CCD7|nr:hypothetical protein [Oceanispirochaeta sp. M1]RDG29769.1 hypothetical protein DV872_19975 [Oceanispirochaeta sp. M1]
MKKSVLLLCMILLVIASVSAQDRPVSYGLHLVMGGRYDDMRMCVGSPAGVKGGPIMDIYFDVRFPMGDRDQLALNIPVARPILFGAAFKMLQFEPQITYERHFGSAGDSHAVVGAGMGLSFHYGPDFESDKNNPGESFFAMGPLFSISAGWQIAGDKVNWMPGIKAFYSPLFSADYPTTGTVAGGALELHTSFNP